MSCCSGLGALRFVVLAIADGGTRRGVNGQKVVRFFSLLADCLRAFLHLHRSIKDMRKAITEPRLIPTIAPSDNVAGVVTITSSSDCLLNINSSRLCCIG